MRSYLAELWLDSFQFFLSPHVRVGIKPFIHHILIFSTPTSYLIGPYVFVLCFMGLFVNSLIGT